MAIIGSNLKEIEAKRFEVKGDVKGGPVQNNVNITNIEERDLNIENLKKGIAFEFEFKSDYTLEKPSGKKLGYLKLVGEILFVDKEKEMDKILKEWKKTKKVDNSVMQQILNVALDNSQIEAISISRKVMLPSPIPLPRLKEGAPSQQNAS